MNAAETIQAAIEKLETLKADTSPAPWFATEDTLYTAETWKGPRGRIAPRPIFMAEGNWVAGYVHIEADAELILALHRTIDAQITILRRDLDIRVDYIARGILAKWEEAVERAAALDLARAILGEDGQSVDATRLGVPAATASETGFDLELGEDGQ
jgi:hypothetical protein